MEPLILLSQGTATALIAAWLTLGVRDNILYPSVNETFTTQVFEMSRLKQDYPQEYARMKHRAVTDPRLHRLAFRVVVVAELAACAVLWAGVVALAMGIAGTALPQTGRMIALIGALLFTAIWAGFLIVGNHFSYWFCHEGAQNTHYQMTLWGLGTMILLMQG